MEIGRDDWTGSSRGWGTSSRVTQSSLLGFLFLRMHTKNENDYACGNASRNLLQRGMYLMLAPGRPPPWEEDMLEAVTNTILVANMLLL